MAVHRARPAARRGTAVALALSALALGAALAAPVAGAQQPNTPTTPPPLVDERPLPDRPTTSGTPTSAATAPSSTAAVPGATGGTPTTIAVDPMEKGGGLNNALPRPNSGHQPQYQGDRGTGSQYAVLGAMLLALLVILSLVIRQSRRSTSRWSAAAPMAGKPPVGQPTQHQPVQGQPAQGRSDQEGSDPGQ